MGAPGHEPTIDPGHEPKQERNVGRVSKPAHPQKARPAHQKRGPSKGRVTPRAVPKATVSNMLFSACLIVKDEEKALPGCLDSLKGLVDEIVVYDTGSTDSTVEIAKRAGAKVIEGYWDDDFGRARNACLEHCLGEWILWIDADEHFVCENTAELRSVMRDRLTAMDADALAVDINNLVGDGSATWQPPPGTADFPQVHLLLVRVAPRAGRLESRPGPTSHRSAARRSAHRPLRLHRQDRGRAWQVAPQPPFGGSGAGKWHCETGPGRRPPG